MTLPGLLASAGVPIGAAAVVDLPPGAPEWVRYVAVVVGGIIAPFLAKAAPAVVARILAGRRAKKLALSEAKKRRAGEKEELAQRLLNDGAAGNDVDAVKLLDEAGHLRDDSDALDAEAAELSVLAGAKRGDQ
jgi:hypothetical protein